MFSTADRNLDSLLPRQLGAFNLQQATEAGFTERMIRTRISSGHWHRLDAGVYTLAAYDHGWEQRCVAAVLSEPFAALGGKTAGVHYGWPDFRPGTVELTVPPTAGHPSRLARIRRSTLIEPRRVGPFTVNSVGLTLIELAGRISYERLDRSFEHTILGGQITMEQMVEWYLRTMKSRRRGLPSIRAMLEHRGDGYVPSESELEARLLAALDAPEIPPVLRQAPFPWAPGGTQRVDAYIEDWGMIVEADGRRWHARLETMDDDARRDQDAVRHGLLTVRFGWADLQSGPDYVRAVVIGSGAHRRGTRLRASSLRSA